MRLPATTLSLLAVLILRATPAYADPVLWTVNGHWYEFVATKMSWTDAFAATNASSFNGMQGYLATVTSAAENSFVSVTIATGRSAWLGGSDAGEEGIWTWRNGPESGQAFTYTNWNPYEPNNLWGEEHYLHLNWGRPGGWNDSSDGIQNGYVIEYGTSVPEPSTLVLLTLGLVGLISGGFRHRDR